MSVITVGKGQQYSSLYLAAPHVKKGDVIELVPGTYSGALFYNSNITIEGMGPGVVITGGTTQDKGLLVLDGSNVTVENVTFEGAQSSDGNGAGIRFEGTNLTVLNSTFIDNQDGILTNPNGKSTITVKNCTFDGNGSDAGGSMGAAHAIYCGAAALLDVENSTFTNTQQGHDIKSRAKNTIIENNSITDGPTGTSSYLIDIPNGGAATITGNTLEKGPNSANSSYAITVGEEGATNPPGPVLIADNTFVNDDKSGVVFAHNQTGYADFTVADNTISGLQTTLITGKGTVIDPTTPNPDPTSASAPVSRTVIPRPLSADFNSDGDADVLLQNKNGQVIAWTMDGTAGLGSGTLRNPGSGWKVIAAADFNGDGKTDVALQYTYGQVQIWTLNGFQLTSGVAVNANPGSGWHAIGAGDFNADGKADLVFQNTDHSIMVWLMNGATKLAGDNVGNPGKNWSAIGAGDFDGDGHSDVLLQNTNTGAVQIWSMNGTSVSSKSTVSTNPGLAWTPIGTGDFNGDGKDDILFQNASGQTMIWEMNGSTVLKSRVVGNPGSSWKAIGADDYNGDGKDDILFQNASGQLMVWTMSGLTVLAKGTPGNPGSAWHAVVGG